LQGSLPAEFKYSYAMIDVTDVPREAASTIADQLHSLLESSTCLAEGGVYLKLFLPQVLKRPLVKFNQTMTVTLEWSRSELHDMLKERIRRASGTDSATGRDSLRALCDPDAQSIDVDTVLVDAAVTPRDLIRLGNELLEIHVANVRDDPLLSLKDIKMWRAKLGKSKRGREVGR